MSIDLLEPGTRSGGEGEPERPLSPTASGPDRRQIARRRVLATFATRRGAPGTNQNPAARVGVMVSAVLLAALPLVIDPDGWYVYVQLRWLVLALAVSALTLFAALSSRHRRRLVTSDGRALPTAAPLPSTAPRSTALPPTALPPTALPWIALVVVAVLAAVLSASPIVALSGAQDRMFGAGTWILHGGCALTAATLVRRRHDLVLLARGMTIGLLGVSVVTIAQRGGFDLASGAASFTRPGGPFGNADMLGAYCVLAVLVTTAVALDRDESDHWRMFAAITATLGMATLVLSGARASWIATGLGLIVLLAAAVRTRQLRALTAIATCGAALVLCVGIGVAAGASDRLDDLTGGTTEGRVQTWSRAIDTLAERPVLGWGEEGFAQGFTGSVDASFEQDYGRRLTPDRAHNGLLDIATTLGLLGLLAYLGVLIATGSCIVRVLAADRRPARRDAPGNAPSDVPRHTVLPLGIAVALGAYLLQQQALFPLADVDALAWLLAGSLVGVSSTIGSSSAGRRVLGRNAVLSADRRSPRRLSRTVLTATVGVVLAGLVTVGTTQFTADRQARVAADAAGQGDPPASLRAAQAALELTPGQVLYALVLADAAVATGDARAIRDAIGTLDRQRALGFDDGRLTLAQARLLIASYDLSAPTVRGTTPDLQRAIDLLGELLRGDGARSEAWLLLGDAIQRRGDSSMAWDSWQHAAQLRPGSLEPRLRLLDGYVAAGRIAEAQQTLAQIDRIGEPSSSAGRFDLMILRARLQAAR